MKTLLTVYLVLFAMTSSLLADQVRVAGTRVNLRAQAGLDAEVVGQVERGELLTSVSSHDEWVEVLPPPHVVFWVHGDFIEDGLVIGSRLNVRSGPGVNYAILATLERGDSITARDTFAEWVSIAPPSDATLWIASDLVLPVRPEPPPEPVVEEAPRRQEVVRTPTPVERPDRDLRPVEPAPRPAVLPPVVERTPPPPPEDLQLIPLDGQGERVEREGVLRPAGFVFGRPSRYRLTRSRGHLIETTAYVRGNEAQLQSLLGHDVRIEGVEYWVQGARYPVLVPEQIILIPGQ